MTEISWSILSIRDFLSILWTLTISIWLENQYFEEIQQIYNFEPLENICKTLHRERWWREAIVDNPARKWCSTFSLVEHNIYFYSVPTDTGEEHRKFIKSLVQQSIRKPFRGIRRPWSHFSEEYIMMLMQF